MPILLRNATVVSMDAAHGAEPFRADILVDGTKIEAVGPDLEAPAGTDGIDCSERLVMPGMVNAHLHSVETPFKGRYDGMRWRSGCSTATRSSACSTCPSGWCTCARWSWPSSRCATA